MTMKKLYSCNICRDERNPDFLVGMNFKGTNNFVIDYTRSTDGAHVCFSCMDQMFAQQKQYDAVRVGSEANQRQAATRG
jgi:hypothetical protein